MNEISSTLTNHETHWSRLITRFREWCELVKLEHTVFALPFALAGLVLATTNLPSLKVVLLTICAFAGARAAAMSLNRIIDAAIDAENPRTKERAIPQGRIRKGEAGCFAFVAFSIMVWAASQLPPLCLELTPIAVLWLAFYSYTKRFTWLCHFCLGIALGGASLGGWLAAGGRLTTAAPWLLALSVSTWVAGFDVIYACQDCDFDRRRKLYSIPARFGLVRALSLSSLLHVITVMALASVGVLLQLKFAFWSGLTLVGLMLFYEHLIVKPDDLSRVNAAFFNINGIVSVICFFCILFDKVKLLPF
jgi:4-hydroxybenzoate polyprenyltransferase